MIPHSNYIIEPIGHIDSGSFGVVEKVRVRNTQNIICGEYARKILINQHEDPDLQTRFIREVRLQDKCLHKNVAQIFICSLDTNPAWFVMELAESSLYTEMVEGNLNKKEKIKIVLMIAEGIAWIHSKGYLHRDIKPKNILKFPDGKYKISDFGIARYMDPSEASRILTQADQFPRTPQYFDHNVVINGYSRQSDIFSLGIIIEELNIEGFDDIITRSTDRKLSKRYISTEQLIADVKKIGEVL
ncbi:protein kinase [Pectobacterium versatile]|uniref:protein kinase domain-containing protein n=1 Tax=Pectobacterium versatile TaxID=2488639 RepID=UPI00166172DD|nr:MULTISPECIES: protein kinase [Pectobacterium]MBD0846849.1 protein kinase [Pectobacterium carotovorum subsp. carotovorum]MBK4824207.1 non-specific serine/threonine protein kinase [Pectobacterium carotovorum subsp. carotovorum]MCA6915465.1 protein kinase [Pectobacterium versatile]UNE79034.1 protein kinase [Pectobacterium versatile]